MVKLTTSSDVVIDTPDDILQRGIAQMYYVMSRYCIKFSDEIYDADDYEFAPIKFGYEMEIKDKGKYQLVCELKKVEE